MQSATAAVPLQRAKALGLAIDAAMRFGTPRLLPGEIAIRCGTQKRKVYDWINGLDIPRGEEWHRLKGTLRSLQAPEILELYRYAKFEFGLAEDPNPPAPPKKEPPAPAQPKPSGPPREAPWAKPLTAHPRLVVVPPKALPAPEKMEETSVAKAEPKTTRSRDHRMERVAWAYEQYLQPQNADIPSGLMRERVMKKFKVSVETPAITFVRKLARVNNERKRRGESAIPLPEYIGTHISESLLKILDETVPAPITTVNPVMAAAAITLAPIAPSPPVVTVIPKERVVADIGTAIRMLMECIPGLQEFDFWVEQGTPRWKYKRQALEENEGAL